MEVELRGITNADVAELADALGSGPSSPKECGFKSHRRYQFFLSSAGMA